MRRLAALLVAVVAAVASAFGVFTPGAADAGAGAPRARTFEEQEPRDCDELVPPGAALPSGSVGFDVLVLLDGVSVAHAQQTLAIVAGAYEPAGIHVAATAYETVSFSTRSGNALIDAARAHVGGLRPGGVDAVLLLTSKDISDGIYGSSLAGLADCIGGVKYREFGFVVSEAEGDARFDARVAAHELGHAAGAHHHYANCVESVSAFELYKPCTVMINDIGLASLTFSTVNASMLRYHLDEYAKP